jgi:hypothetical protein
MSFITQAQKDFALRQYANCLEDEWNARGFFSKSYLHSNLQRSFNYRAEDKLFYAGLDFMLAANGYPSNKDCIKRFGFETEEDKRHGLRTGQIFDEHNTHETAELKVIDALLSDDFRGNKDAERAKDVFRKAANHPMTYYMQAILYINWPIMKGIDLVFGKDTGQYMSNELRKVNTIRRMLR